MGTTTFGASKISRLDIPRFFRGIVGAVLGFGIELVSILVAMQITAAFVTGNPSDITVWLANFRLFNIPILIGIGFLVAMGTETPNKRLCVKWPETALQGHLAKYNE